MPQEADAGKRLARDMRRIREARNLSVEDLHDETKIPLGLIQAFEGTGLFDHPQFNRVYLRSFMRTYAQVVGIDADIALESLEEALAGRYAGELAVEYLGESRQTMEDESTDEKERAADSGDSGRKRDEGESIPPILSTTGDVAADRDESDADYRTDDGARPVDEEEVDEDWASQSPPSGRRSASAIAAARTGARGPSRGRPDRREGGQGRRWFIAGGMIIVVAAVVWVMIALLGGDSERQASDPAAAVDTSLAMDTVQAQEPIAAPIDVPAIGDTIDVYVIAAHASVDPIRVTVDDDLRRPYWIDQGDSLAFQPAQRIVLEELLDNIELTVEGIEYPTDRRDEQGRIVINRDSVETYFASLQQGL